MPYQFKPSYLVSSLFFVIILVFTGLGTWQLSLANKKQALQKIVDQRSILEPLSLNMPFEELTPYQMVQATGQYRAKDSILLDNIEHQYKPGYFKLGYYLLTPFEITASRAIILVNRGWLPQGKTREDLPKFKTPEGLITLEGHLSHYAPKPDLKGKAASPLSSTPPLWHFMDQDFFSQINGYSILPLQLKLKTGGQTSTFHSTSIPNVDIETALIQSWPNYDAKTSKHKEHSIQWFLFALFTLIAYLGFSFKKISLTDNKTFSV